MTTEAGLVRYDGMNTRVFDLTELSLKSNRLFNFFPTVQNDILCCNRRGEVFAIKNNVPVAVAANNTLSVYTFSYQYGNARSVKDLNFELNITNKFTGDSFSIINSVWLSKNVWIAISNSHTYLFNNNQLIHQWQIKNEAGSLIIKQDSMVYVLRKAASGYFINLNNYALSNTLSNDTVLQKGNPVLFYDKLNEEPLILKNNSLYKLLLTQNIIYTGYIATVTNVPTYITSIIFNESNRTIFISTNSTGVHIYHQNPFITYRVSNDDILNNNSASLLIDSTHIFTCRSVIFNLKTGESKHVNTPITHTQSLTQDTNKNIWSAFAGNIVSFKLNEPGKIRKYPVEGDNFLQTCYLSSNNKLWISTFKFLGYLENDSIKKFITYSSNPDSISFTYLTETPAGRLTGINTKGIYFIDTVLKKIVPLTNSELFMVRFIYIDSNNFFWIATYGNGMFLFDERKNKLVKLPVDDKRYLLFCHAFIEDGHGNFLVPTNKGLFRLNKKNLLSIYKNPSTPLYYQYYDVSSGLLTNEFNGGGETPFNLLPGGDIIVPSINGLVRIKTNELPLPSQSKLFVDEIETKTKSYKPLNNIEFNSDERTQVWNISFAEWNEPNSQCIFFRIDDTSLWQRLGAGEKRIQLNELSGGSHSLEIKHQYGFLENQYSLYQYKFYVGKRYYETVWFWSAVFVLTGLFIFLINRFRTLQLKRKNIQLQKIIQQNTRELSGKNADLEETLKDLNEALKILKENSIFKNRLIGLLGHDMLVPLRFIANISNHLYTTENLTTESAKETSVEIKNTAVELLYLGESLIQWIKLQEGSFKLILQNIDVKKLAEEIILIHKNPAAVKNNTVVCDIPAALFCVYDATIIKVILHNILLNANKFTTGGIINVQAGIAGNFLTVRVKDTGTGMEPAMVDSLNNLKPVASKKGTEQESGWGMGYILIIDLLHFANGKLHIGSKPAAGTEVSFSLPLQKAYSI